MSREDHPVWTVYDRLRTARLNCKYYGRRLQQHERTAFWMQLLLLATAPSSAIAGLWFWASTVGKAVWQFTGIAAAVVAVVMPLLGLTKKIKDYEAILSGYRVLDYDLMQIKSSIEQKRRYDRAGQIDFEKALERERTLVSKNPEAREMRSLIEECQREVLEELPTERFFVPKEEMENASP